MARYNPLTDDERRILFDIPTDHAALIRHYTLTPDEIELVLARRGDRNRLGVAVQLCLLRHPGFGLRDNEPVPDELDLSRFDSGPDRRLSTIKETGLWDKDTVKTSSDRRFG